MDELGGVYGLRPRDSGHTLVICVAGDDGCEGFPAESPIMLCHLHGDIRSGSVVHLRSWYVLATILVACRLCLAGAKRHQRYWLVCCYEGCGRGNGEGERLADRDGLGGDQLRCWFSGG